MTARCSTHRRVLIDLNTQCDFLLPGGALPVANRDHILPRIRALMTWARNERVPVVSSLEAHRPGETHRGLPPFCIDRTRGQRKVPFTLMPRRVLVQGDNTFDLPADPFAANQQIVFTKRHDDFLSNPKADRLINSIRPEYWLLTGIAATHSVKSIALGLMARHFHVVVVRDCCGYWSATDCDHAIRQMEAKGAVIVDSETVISGEIETIMHDRLAARSETEDEAVMRVSSQRLRNLRHARDADNGNGNGHRKAEKSTKTGEPRKPKVTDFIPKKLLRNKQGSGGNRPTP